MRLVGAFLAAHLHLQLQFLLLEAQLLLFHLDHRVAEDVLLLGEVGLSVEDLHVETLIAEDQDDVAFAYVRALLRDDCLHHAALQRAELHSGHRYHAPADADVVVELAAAHLAHGDGFSAHTQLYEQQRPAPVGQRLAGEKFAYSFGWFYLSVHLMVIGYGL